MLGPYALALSESMMDTQSKRDNKIEGSFIGYRGLQLTPEEIARDYRVGKTTRLNGYTSISLNKEIAK